MSGDHAIVVGMVEEVQTREGSHCSIFAPVR
jgi:hypothetical protein